MNRTIELKATEIVGLARPKPTFMWHFARRVHEDRLIYAAIFAYALVALTLLQLAGGMERSTFLTYLDRWALPVAIALPGLILAGKFYLVRGRAGRRRRLAMRLVFSPDRMAALFAGVVLLVAFMLFQGTFTSIKNSLVLWWGHFPFDRAQADLDALLHFGDPWRHLYAVAANGTVLSVLEWNYGVLWFLVCFGALAFVALTPDMGTMRTRFLLSFMLVWVVVGNVFAGLFMSAGPVYYGQVTGDEARFAAQLAFLAAHVDTPYSAAAYQDYLWRLHEAGAAGFGSGISAFPSMHVGLTAMIALYAWEKNRALGVAAWAYVALIQTSSVYLAWHYAIDGYAAILLVVALHAAVRRLVPEPRPAER